MLDLSILAAAGHAAAGQVAEHAAEHGGGHITPTALGLTPGGWVAMSMLFVFALMLYLKVPAIVAGMLDKRIAGIRTMLDEAATLRKQAEALKAEYEAKVANAARAAEELKAGAEHEASLIVEKARQDAEALIVRRRKIAEDKIAAAELAAIAELRARAANAAAVAARGLIAENHSAGADKALVDQAIAAI